MKKIILISFAVILIIAACQKERLAPTNANLNSNTSTAARDDDPNHDDRDSTVCKVTFCNGVAIFADSTAYQNAYDCLEQKHETWNTDFDNAHNTMTTDAIEDLIESIGWDENYKLHYFENFYSHPSYQSYLDSLEDIWLAGGTWNPATDPDNLDFFDDEITNTFFSTNGMLLIGKTLLIIDVNGDLWALPNADCSIISQVNQNPDDLQYHIKATKLFGNSGTYGNECLDYAKETDYLSYGTSPERKIKMKLKYNASHFGGDVTNMRSKIKTYKKKNSKWRSCRRELETTVQGSLSTACLTFNPYSSTKVKKRRSLKASWYINGYGYYYYYHINTLIGTYKDNTSGITATIVK